MPGANSHLFPRGRRVHFVDAAMSYQPLALDEDEHVSHTFYHVPSTR